MPLRGFTCPPGGEEPGRRNTIEYCLSKCAKPCVMPPLLAAIWKSEQGNYHKGDYISASMITGSACDRQKVLERYEAYWEVPQRKFWAFRGTMAHRMCEDAVGFIDKFGWLQEVRLSIPLEYDLPAPIFDLKADPDTGELVKVFTGQYDSTKPLVITFNSTFDAYNPFQRKLADIKSMKDAKAHEMIQGSKKGTLYSKHLQDEHVAQTNIYRWAISKTKIPDEVRERFRELGLPELKGKFYPAPTQLIIQGLSMMEIPRSGATYSVNSRGGTTLYDVDDVPVWPLHETEAFIRPRALQWYKWLVLREPVPVVPKSGDWVCRSCPFNGEKVAHGICFPEKERKENAFKADG